MANENIKVSIEKVIHDGLRDYAQKVFDEYGIVLKTFNFTWHDVSGIDNIKMIVSQVEAITYTKK